MHPIYSSLRPSPGSTDGFAREKEVEMEKKEKGILATRLRNLNFLPKPHNKRTNRNEN